MGSVRAAAIVNATARRVRGRLPSQLERALPGAVSLTRTLAEARAAIRAEVARGVDLLVLGGGDGTVVMGLSLLAEACRGEGRPAPAIGVLRLGEGSAIAAAAGATDDPAEDLDRLARGDGAWRPWPVIEVLGLRAPLVGIGAGAELREDRAAVGRVVDRIPVARRLVGGAARSALSLALRSVQRIAAPSRVRAVITNTGAPALELSRGAPTGRKIAAGQPIWAGPCALIEASTMAALGSGAPAAAGPAGARDRFLLRCGEAGLRDLLPGAPAALRGLVSAEPVGDFLCDHIQIQLDGPLSIEAGGELLGHRQALDLSLSAPVTVASLLRVSR